VPYAVGLNNHMGSAMTSSLFGMQKVMQALERYNLYFLDSMTIGNSQAMRAAQGTGVKVIKRKVFLDDTQNEADIRVSSIAPSSWRAATVPPLPSATRTRLRCASCSRCCITCRRYHAGAPEQPAERAAGGYLHAKPPPPERTLSAA
jgi:hypothetical protein